VRIRSARRQAAKRSGKKLKTRPALKRVRVKFRPVMGKIVACVRDGVNEYHSEKWVVALF
jgi:hypothetical protein